MFMRTAIRAAAPLRVSRALSTEVPITQVARVWRSHVNGEKDAVALDELIANRVLPELRQQPGYVKTVRTVCKAEWAYEFSIVFASLDDFQAYMASDYHKKLSEQQMPQALDFFAKNYPEDFYAGNRVYDEWP